MATYPTGVAAFTTKNNGDTIQPSHVNSLQDEITAIEDGILNGTAPLNSSRVTAPSLQISGNSTFVGTITASSNVVSSGQFTAANQPAWNVYSTAVILGTAASTVSVAFESESVDQGGFHSTVASTNTAIVVPAGSSGLYAVSAVAFGLNFNAQFDLFVVKNGARIAGVQTIVTASAGASAYVQTLARLDAADIIRMELAGPGASTWSVTGNLTGFESRCCGVKLS